MPRGLVAAGAPTPSIAQWDSTARARRHALGLCARIAPTDTCIAGAALANNQLRIWRARVSVGSATLRESTVLL